MRRCATSSIGRSAPDRLARQEAVLRIGLLGTARIARHAVIDPASRLAGVEVVAVASRDTRRAEAYAAEHAIPQVEKDYDALLKRRDIDLVYVPLVNSEHTRWSIRAVEAGHAVLCEKPLAPDAAQARDMVAASERAGRPLIEAFHYRHHALMHWLVEQVGTGLVGRVVAVNGHFVAGHGQSDRTRWGPELGGGALLTLGCYPLHAMRTLFGEPLVLAVEARWIDGVDAELVARLRFGAADATIRCALDAPHRSAGLTVTGEEGSISIENFLVPQLPHRVVVDRAGKREEHQFGGPGTFDAQLAHVARVLKGDSAPLTGGADAIANMVAMDAMLAIAKGNPT